MHLYTDNQATFEVRRDKDLLKPAKVNTFIVCIKNQFLIGHFSNSFFLSNANKIEMNFCLYMCILMGNSFLLLQRFWGKNAKIDFFKKKNGFESSFYKIDDWVVTNWSVRLEKHQTLEILLVVFLRILKNVAFFKIFREF